MKKNIVTFLTLLFFFLLVFFAQLLGSLATSSHVEIWYRMLNTPSWTPPGWVFTPVWTLLFICIALSGFFIFKGKESKYRSIALTLWTLQLIVNTVWSFAFFYFQSPLLGALDVSILTVLIGATFAVAQKITAGAYFLLPYLGWVCFAAILNWTIVYLN
ncbi:MAG: tryptophan-rich sensory protein [Chlamydiota bacterium]|jgi:tryptophan-rich sensory protein